MKNLKEFILEASINFSTAAFVQASGAMNSNDVIKNVKDYVTKLLDKDVNLFALESEKVIKVNDINSIKFKGAHFGQDVIELAAKTIKQLKPGKVYFIGDSISWTNKETVNVINAISKVCPVVINVVDLNGHQINKVSDLYKDNNVQVFSLC